MKNRKKWFIEPEFQVSFMKFTATILVVVAAIFYGAILYFFHSFNELGAQMGLQPGHVFFQFIDAQKSKMNLIIGISFLVTSAIFICWSVFVSNKIAGPIYRLKKELSERLASGQHRDIAFRKGDYFTELADLINESFKR